MVGNGKPTTAINLAGPLVQTPANAFSWSKPTCAVLEPHIPASLMPPDQVWRRQPLSQRSRWRMWYIRIRNPTWLCSQRAGPRASHDLLKSPRLGELPDEARPCYERIIVDTSPPVPAADCRLIEQRIDGFLVLVTVHMALRKLFEETLTVIDPATLLGLIQDDRQIPGYHAGYYAQSPNGSQNGRHSFRRRKIR